MKREGRTGDSVYKCDQFSRSGESTGQGVCTTHSNWWENFLKNKIQRKKLQSIVQKSFFPSLTSVNKLFKNVKMYFTFLWMLYFSLQQKNVSLLARSIFTLILLFLFINDIICLICILCYILARGGGKSDGARTVLAPVFI